jgi:hypothetical protein
MYKYIYKNKNLNYRTKIWVQEFNMLYLNNCHNYIIQNLCINSGKKRSITQLFQLYRLELKAAVVKLDLAGTYYAY